MTDPWANPSGSAPDPTSPNPTSNPSANPSGTGSVPTPPPPPMFSAPDPSYTPAPVPLAPAAPPPASAVPVSGYQTGSGYGGYGGYPGYVVQQKTNGMAVASMVVSIVGLLMLACYGAGAVPCAVGAVLGHVANRQIRERNESGRGMALAGIIMGWIGVGIGVVVLIAVVAIVIWAASTAS